MAGKFSRVSLAKDLADAKHAITLPCYARQKKETNIYDMYWLMLLRSFSRGWKPKVLATATVALGAALCAVLLNMSFDVGHKMASELRAYGANLSVAPRTVKAVADRMDFNFDPLAQTSFLNEKDLVNIKQIFWQNNILSFNPVIYGRGEIKGAAVPLRGVWFDKKVGLADGREQRAGIRYTKPWLRIKGRRPTDDAKEALVGKTVARGLGIKTGERIRIGIAGRRTLFLVTGIMSSGEQIDEEILLPLSVVQKELGLRGKINEAEISALTVPENELAKKYKRDPDSLTSAEWESWYCTPYIGAIAVQIEEVMPGSAAKAIRRIAESEDLIIRKVKLLMMLLSGSALIGTALAISSLMTAAVLERGKEIGIAKALGAADWLVVGNFLSEAGLMGAAGGVIGYIIGIGGTLVAGPMIFGSAIALNAAVLPLTVLISLVVTFAGSAPATMALIKLSPVEALHG